MTIVFVALAVLTTALFLIALATGHVLRMLMAYAVGALIAFLQGFFGLGDPPIGVPRLYAGEVLKALYPGETAHATGGVAADGRVLVTEWLVEPAPGWFARWQRLRWRVWGRWWTGGAPALVTTVQIEEVEP
jgi:hypothetical protein